VHKLAPDLEIADSIVGFHSQQAVEKWLKAVIASRGEDFEFTHDLHRLVMLATHGSGELPFDVDAVIALTQYAVPLRYEDLLDAEPLDRDATIELLNAVGKWAGTELSLPAD
jgi:HEPN domain-containing protein